MTCNYPVIYARKNRVTHWAATSPTPEINESRANIVATISTTST